MSALELDDDECSICFGNLKNRSNVKLRCTHHFCLKCTILHLNQKNDCPLCRGAVLPTNDYKTIFQKNKKLTEELNISRRRLNDLQNYVNIMNYKHSELKKKFNDIVAMLELSKPPQEDLFGGF